MYGPACDISSGATKERKKDRKKKRKKERKGFICSQNPERIPTLQRDEVLSALFRQIKCYYTKINGFEKRV